MKVLSEKQQLLKSIKTTKRAMKNKHRYGISKE